MSTTDLIKTTEKSGTKIAREKLIELLRKTNQKEFNFSSDGTGRAVIVIPFI